MPERNSHGEARELSGEESRELAGELGRLIARSRRLVWTAASRRLAERGESMLAWQVLNYLGRVGCCHQRELAEAIAQHPAGISRMLEELEAKGLAQRERDPEDRRRSAVTLTTRGKKWVATIRPEVSSGVATALDRLDYEERLQLRDLLLKLLGSPDADLASLRSRR
jgi:DNA-binding MarR family transcriptional regulator